MIAWLLSVVTVLPCTELVTVGSPSWQVLSSASLKEFAVSAWSSI